MTLSTLQQPPSLQPSAAAKHDHARPFTPRGAWKRMTLHAPHHLDLLVDPRPCLIPGTFCTAVDRHGALHPLMYSVLENGGHGNAVLICRKSFDLTDMPRIVAFGETIAHPASGGHQLGDWWVQLRSFTRLQHPLRGHDSPGSGGASELIELRWPCTPSSEHLPAH